MGVLEEADAEVDADRTTVGAGKAPWQPGALRDARLAEQRDAEVSLSAPADSWEHVAAETIRIWNELKALCALIEGLSQATGLSVSAADRSRASIWTASSTANVRSLEQDDKTSNRHASRMLRPSGEQIRGRTDYSRRARASTRRAALQERARRRVLQRLTPDERRSSALPRDSGAASIAAKEGRPKLGRRRRLVRQCGTTARAPGCTNCSTARGTRAAMHVTDIDCGRHECLHVAAVVDYRNRKVSRVRACLAWKSSEDQARP